MKKIVIAAIACLGAVVAHAAPATVHAAADSTVLTMGDRVGVTVEVVKNAGPGVLVDMPQKEKDFHGMEMVDLAVDSAAVADNRTMVTYRFTFQAFDPQAVLTLPPFRYAMGTDTVKSDILTFKVLPVDLSPELGDPNNIDSLTVHPLETVVAIRAKWYDFIPDWSIWVVLGLVLAALGVTLLILYKKNGPQIFIKKKPTPPYELAMQRLYEIKRKGLAEQGRAKEYYTELTDTLRSYLEGRFGIYAMEMTSSQILQCLRENKDTRLSADQIQQVLELADFVKFAGMRPLPDDNIKTFNTIYDFVESTKPLPEPEEKPDGKPKA